MNPLTIECEVHFQARSRGRKELEVGASPSPTTPGPVPRVSSGRASALSAWLSTKTGRGR